MYKLLISNYTTKDVYYRKFCKMSCEPKRLPRYLPKYNPLLTSTSSIRNAFLNYFQKEDHVIVEPCKVLSKNQGSYFINSGVSQFRDRILGDNSIFNEVSRAANSQTCIRLGGKSCDWQHIGHDPVHLSCFEMLGNWSFRDYGKEKACSLMWHFLTDVLKLPPSHLYVTYFGGCPDLNLPPDEETRDIWFKLGVKDNKILECGVEHNFWEMGERRHDVLCGASTEIHWDYLATASQSTEAREEDVAVRCARCFVNSDSPEVVELWNCVFIQHQWHGGRLESMSGGGLVVDTGMGLERLASVMQGVSSVYDTDNLSNIISTIHSLGNAPTYEGTFANDYRHTPSTRLQTNASTIISANTHRSEPQKHEALRRDIAYRVVADHLRAVCVAIRDGVSPGRQDVEGKVRQLVQRALRQALGPLGLQSGCLVEVVDCVCDQMTSDVREAMRTGIKNVIRKEEENFLKVYQKQEDAFKRFLELRQNDSAEISAEECRSLNRGEYGSAGISLNLIEAMARDCDLRVAHEEEAPLSVEKEKEGGRRQDLAGVACTDTGPVYRYEYEPERGMYTVQSLRTRVTAVLLDSGSQARLGLFTEASCMYPGGGGQSCDEGVVTRLQDNQSLPVTSVERIDAEHIVHWCSINGDIDPDSLRDWDGAQVSLHVDEKRRYGCTVHHTAQHLMTAALEKELGGVLVKSSSVRPTWSSLTFSLHPETGNPSVLTDPDLVARLESICQRVIEANHVVEIAQDVDMVSARQTEPDLRITLESRVPARARLVRVSPESLEPCCGTHAHRTGQLETVVVTALRRSRQTKVELVLVAGSAARVIREHTDAHSEQLCAAVTGCTTRSQLAALAVRMKTHLTGQTGSNSGKTAREALAAAVKTVPHRRIDVRALLPALLQAASHVSVPIHFDLSEISKVINTVMEYDVKTALIIHDEQSTLLFVPENFYPQVRERIFADVTEQMRHSHHCFKPKYRRVDREVSELCLVLTRSGDHDDQHLTTLAAIVRAHLPSSSI